MNEKAFLIYGIIGIILFCVGAVLDSLSSRNFSSYNNNMRERNPLFRLPNGDCNVKKKLVYSAIIALALLVTLFIFPEVLGLAWLFAGVIFGGLQSMFAFNNWSAKKRVGKKPVIADSDAAFQIRK
jgi:hypothetical protein